MLRDPPPNVLWRDFAAARPASYRKGRNGDIRRRSQHRRPQRRGVGMRGKRVRLLAALALLNVVAGTTVVGVARAAVDADIPSSLHGAVETQAITAGNGALALF